MRLRATLLLALLGLPALAGCLGGAPDAREALVPYPRLGDVATYEARGALVEFARWENAHTFIADPARVRFTLEPGPDALDGARAIHPTFLVRTEVADGGPFIRRAERYVSPIHQGVVQGHYPLSQDQSVLSFDERGFPWLFGASALFGEDLARESAFAIALPDNLGRGQRFDLSWRVVGEESVDGVATTRLDLAGAPGMEGTLWMERGSAWPLRARLAILDGSLAPHVRADGATPATLEARRVEVAAGREGVPPRNRGAGFGEDNLVLREGWDGEKPPDGAPGAVTYLLSEAVRDAKLLDPGLQAFLQSAKEPRLYRGTFQQEPGPAEGTRNDHWLLQFVSEDDRYYEVQVGRLTLPQLPTGVPRIEKSAPAEGPSDENHGWFPRDAVPERIVPLSEGVRIVQEVFGAPNVQVFLRSFTDPAGYSYFIDGGFEQDGGRYTVVYNPNTGFIEQATGPVSPRVMS